MRRPRERGVALVAATMAVAVLTVVAVGFAVTATTGDRLAANALATVQAEALARSGVAAARAALVDASAAGAPDTLASPWALPLEPQALGAGTVQVEVVDEARRLDLNAVPDALPALLSRLGLDPLVADAILDWTDADDVARPHGAERAWYRAQQPPRGAANRPLATVGELLLVRGIDERMLARLRPFVTAAGEDGVNPNTAPPEVLFAVWPDPSRVGEITAARARGPVECQDLPHCTTTSRSYTVRSTGTVGGARRTIAALVRVLPSVDTEIDGWTWEMAEPP
ncbi:MAG TPA: type II secretion system minor pseudopilin GspK [Candidatus Eisenbacteria bacterium]|nr:type II secretion system minor pseudopilin GspK [Candidatus Eisenbacteria bacterium]